MSLPQIIFAMMLGWIIFSAWTRCGWDARIAASAILGATFLTPVAQLRDFAGPEMGIVFVDALLFSVLLVVALRSRAFWPIWAAGFQLGALAVHFAAARLPSMIPAAYAETLVIWSFPVLAVVAVGILREIDEGQPGARLE
ncbi:MAG: hypothetical protein ACK4TG_06060 [Thermaurantiacus sp.]